MAATWSKTMNLKALTFFLFLQVSPDSAGIPNDKTEFVYKGKAVSVWVSDLLNASDFKTQRNALKAFEAMGSAAKGAVPKLEKAFLQRPAGIPGGLAGRDNRFLARAALARIGEPAVPCLVEALKTQQKKPGGGSRQVILTLGATGPKAKAAVPDLLLI